MLELTALFTLPFFVMGGSTHPSTFSLMHEIGFIFSMFNLLYLEKVLERTIYEVADMCQN